MFLRLSMPNRFQFRMLPDWKNVFFHQGGDIHYIGGAEILPAPLEPGEEAACIECLGAENAEAAKNKLVEHNLRLVVYIAKKFDNTGVGVEDLISIGTIENEILMYLRRNSKVKLEVSIDEPLNVDWDGNELLLSDILGTSEDMIYKDIEREVDIKLLKKALETLSDRERMIIHMRFGLDDYEGGEKTQKEVADLLGISQSYISRLEKKIMKRLKKEILRLEGI